MALCGKQGGRSPEWEGRARRRRRAGEGAQTIGEEARVDSLIRCVLESVHVQVDVREDLEEHPRATASCAP